VESAEPIILAWSRVMPAARALRQTLVAVSRAIDRRQPIDAGHINSTPFDRRNSFVPWQNIQPGWL